MALGPLTPRSVFRYFNVDGVPSSGNHKPSKAEIIQLLETLFGTSRGGWVVARTRIELNGIVPGSETDGGVVLADPDPANNGYYERSEGAWVKGRGFPDTFARVELSGDGTMQSGDVKAGVNPADIEVFYAFVETVNTDPLRLSIGGGEALPVVNLAGNPLTPGEWTDTVMFANRDGKYQLLLDAGSAASAAQSASDAAASASAAHDDAQRAEDEADRAKDEADRAQGNADDAASYAGYRDFADVQDLLTNTSLQYGTDPGQVQPGDFIRTRKEGFSYEVAAPDAAGAPMKTAGDVNLYPLGQVLGFRSLRQAGCVGDGITDDTAARDAIYAYCKQIGAPLWIEAGRYVFSSPWVLDATNPFVNIVGAGASSTDLDFSPMTSGVALSVPAPAYNGTISGFRALGNSNIDGLSLTGYIISSVKDVRLQGFKTGLMTQSMWDSYFENFHTIGCTKSLALGGQSNNLTFVNGVLGNSQTANTFINCENITFIGCDYSEFMSSPSSSSLFQSSLVFIGCYFEHHARPILGVGSATEDINSSLKMQGGIINTNPDAGFMVSGYGVDLEVDGLRAGWKPVKVHNGTDDTAPPRHYARRLVLQTTGSPQHQRPPALIVNGDPGIFPRLTGATASTPGPRSRIWGIPASTFNGVYVSSNLVIGEQYTLAIAARKTDSSTTLGIAVGTSGQVPARLAVEPGEDFEIRYFPFVAGFNVLRLVWDKPLDIAMLRLYRGIPGELKLEQPQRIEHDGPPSAGGLAFSWPRGTVIDNANAASGQPSGWQCVAAGAPGTWVSRGNLA